MNARILRSILLLLLALPATAGCSSLYSEPPTADGSFANDRLYERPVIVVGRLSNPERARVQWADIGAGMSAALAASLRNDSRYEAWVDPPFAAQVVKSLQQVGERRERGLAQLRKGHGNVRFVVVGAVTDFAHTGDLPRTLRRRALIGRKNEAVVAIRLEVIDLGLGRIVASDHIFGLASAKGAGEDFYADMAFGSYLFWSTPLGRASEKAIARTVDEVNAALVLDRPLPQSAPEPRLVSRQTDPRTLELASEVDPSAESGRLYFVCEIDQATGEHHAVFDPGTGYPLKARIDGQSGGVTTRTAVLIGSAPSTANLSGAMLCPVSADDRVLVDP